MMRTILVSAALAVLGLAGPASGGASAQELVTFVAANGVDFPGGNQNNCGDPAAPCRSLFAAYNRTADKGTVTIQGPFLNLNQTGSSYVFAKNVNIVASGNVVSNSAVLEVPAGQNVLIKGITFLGITGGTGLQLVGPGKTTIKDCVFSDFSGPAVNLVGPAGARAVLDGVTITNSGVGLSVKGANGASNVAFVQNSLIDGSTGSAIVVDGAANRVVISDSTLSGSGQVDLSLLNGGNATSYKSNVIRSGTPTQSLPEN